MQIRMLAAIECRSNADPDPRTLSASRARLGYAYPLVDVGYLVQVILSDSHCSGSKMWVRFIYLGIGTPVSIARVGAISTCKCSLSDQPLLLFTSTYSKKSPDIRKLCFHCKCRETGPATHYGALLVPFFYQRRNSNCFYINYFFPFF
jgi:hypothetical protein